MAAGAVILLVCLLAVLSLVMRRMSVMRQRLEKEIARQTAAHEELAVLNRRYECVLNAAGAGILRLDENGVHTFVNKAALDMLGYTETEMLGQKSHALWHHTRSSGERYAEEDCAILATLYRSETVRCMDEVFWRKNRTALPVEYVCTPILENGRVAGAVLVFQDMTEHGGRDLEYKRRTGRMFRQQDALMQLSRVGSSDFRDFLSQVTEIAAKTLEVDRVTVWFFNQERSALVCEDRYIHRLRVHENGALLPVLQYPTFFSEIEQSRNIAAHDVYADPRVMEFMGGYFLHQEITSMIAVPLLREGRLAGVLSADHVGPKRTWAMDEQEFMASVADTVALALESRERRLAEDTLRQSEEMFRKLTALAPVGVYRADSFGRYQYVNDRWQEMTGLQAKEAMGEGWKTGVHPLDVERVSASWGKMVETQGKWEEEYRCQPLSRKPVWVMGLATPLFDEAGRPGGYIGISVDISARKEQEKALLESERRFKDIIENVHLLGVMLDVQGNILFCNNHFLSHTGWTFEQVKGQDWFSMFIPPDNGTRRVFEDLIEKGTMPAHTENVILTRQGGRRKVRWNNSILKDLEGRVCGTMSLGEDMTERRATEEGAA
ncbi:MAG: PAS domain S-box protein [Candidatus Omnitrophica bacterium]|nr:PAS domain S-box protein [Candidatus Omnitrophota bacterium]